MPECFKVVCIPCKVLYKCSAFLMITTQLSTDYVIPGRDGWIVSSNLARHLETLTQTLLTVDE